MSMHGRPEPYEGRNRSISSLTPLSVLVPLRAETVRAVKARVGKKRVSAYIEAATIRQLERDGLAELVADFEERHGPISPEEVEAARREMFDDSDGT